MVWDFKRNEIMTNSTDTIFKNAFTDNSNILNNLNDVICSFSSKLDFYEIESEFFDAISSIIPAHGTAIYLFKPFTYQPDYISGIGVEKDFLSFYEKRGREIDPLKRWIIKNHSPNHSQLLLGLEGWRNHPLYDIVKTAGLDFGMQAPITSGNDIIGSINLGRMFSEGSFKKQDLLTVSILSHFLNLALGRAVGNNCIKEYNLRYCNDIDNMKQAMVITDKDSNINYINRAAQDTIIRYFSFDNPNTEFSNQLKKLSNGNRETVINNLKLRRCIFPGLKDQQNLVFIDENPIHAMNSSVQETFSTREMDVLHLIEKGMQNKEIAEKLFISVNTIKYHLNNMYGKMGVTSRTELICKIYNLNKRSFTKSLIKN